MADPTEADERREKRVERLLRCFQLAHNHELPNHLVAIQGLVRLLKLEMATKLDDGCQEILNRLEAAAQRTDEVIRTLAAVGRVGVEPSARAPIPLDEVAREAGAAVSQLFPRAVMEYHFPDEPVIVTLANSALHQVLYHLLRHAAQSVPVTESVHVQVGARKQDTWLEIWVADDGPGLSDREREQVLEPFAGDHRQEAARGLGLFLVSQWVNYWGGEIYADSKPDRGSLITVSCPITVVRGPLQIISGSGALDKTLGTTDQAK